MKGHHRQSSKQRRNRAIIEILVGYGLFFLVIVPVGLVDHGGLPKSMAVLLCLPLVLGGFYLYFQGCFRLARAKGYDDGVVLAVIIVGSICLPFLVMAIPFILLFGLKDKNQRASWDK